MRLEQPISVGALFSQIFNMSPVGIRFAIDAEYVSADTMISDGDEIAFYLRWEVDDDCAIARGYLD